MHRGRDELSVAFSCYLEGISEINSHLGASPSLGEGQVSSHLASPKPCSPCPKPLQVQLLLPNSQEFKAALGFFWEGGVPTGPGTCSVSQTGLEHRDLPASASGIKGVCLPLPSCTFWIFIK